MGRKQTGAGKCLPFFRAWCLAAIVWIAGCSYLHDNANRVTVEDEGKEGIRWAKVFFARADYAASLNEAERILHAFPNTAGDKALYQIGLVMACLNNPNKDYGMALAAFRRIQKDYPQSPLYSEATVMENLLQQILDAAETVEKKEAGNKQLTKSLAAEREKTENLNDRVGAFRAETEELKNQIEKLKEIDMVIQEKKSQVK